MWVILPVLSLGENCDSASLWVEGGGLLPVGDLWAEGAASVWWSRKWGGGCCQAWNVRAVGGELGTCKDLSEWFPALGRGCQWEHWAVSCAVRTG